MAKYLLEIGVEELPHKFIPSACNQLKLAFENTFKEYRLNYSAIDTYATPRRLVVIVSGLEQKQPDIVKPIKGPPAKIAYNDDGSLSKAGIGFLKKQGIQESDLSRIDEKGVEYLYSKVEQKGLSTSDILAKEVPCIVLSLQGAHFMRWADLGVKFSRPIRWIVSLMDRDEVPLNIAGVSSKKESRGHRYSKNFQVKINSADEYFESLQKANVIVDQNKRLDLIKELLNKQADLVGGRIKEDKELLSEITNIVEWPVPVLCSFDDDYLSLPEDVNVTVMKSHQRYFPVYSSEGKLMNYFITIANYVGSEYENIKIGNERVIKARLDDAKFFYNEDLKKKFSERVEDLSGITFQRGLGSMYDKTLRLQKLSALLAESLHIERSKIDDIEKCASLCKVDLLTNLVQEFTELEGYIGADYSLKEGVEKSVADGIREHYYPIGADGEVAKTTEGQLVGIVDKVDTIVTTFAIGKKPTGSADPLGIRRATLGVISTILKNNLKIDVSDLIKNAIDMAPVNIEDKKKLQEEVEEFFIGRFKISAQGQGYKHDIIEAVVSARNPLSDLFDANYRFMVLSNLLDEDDFMRLDESANRIIRIIKDMEFANLEVDPTLFKHEAEGQLYNCVKSIGDSNLTYEELIKQLFCLESKISNFFDNVLVMDNDEKIKHNRLVLLEIIKRKFLKLADFSKIAL